MLFDETPRFPIKNTLNVTGVSIRFLYRHDILKHLFIFSLHSQALQITEFVILSLISFTQIDFKLIVCQF